MHVMWQPGSTLAAYATCLPAQVTQDGSRLKYSEIMRTRPGSVERQPLIAVTI